MLVCAIEYLKEMCSAIMIRQEGTKVQRNTKGANYSFVTLCLHGYALVTVKIEDSKTSGSQ